MTASPVVPRRLWMTSDETPTAGLGPRSPEFPQQADIWPQQLSRRHFVQIMGASLALGGLNGCRLPEQKIVPYTQQPEKLVPGNPLHYATTLRVNGQPRGVLVTQYEGRPTHIAGNPLHPLSLGACDSWTTASILDLYDPDRLKTVRRQQGVASWGDFQEVVESLHATGANDGDGLCVLTPPLCSPTEIRLMQQLLKTFPRARWFMHDPLEPGEPTQTVDQINLEKADVIFSLDSDFLFDRPDSLALTRAFSKRRQSEDGRTWNRLYVAETCPSITGAKADHRFPLAPQDFEELATALLASIKANGSSSSATKWPWLDTLASDLRTNPGRSVLLAGRAVPAAARNALQQVNFILENSGKTIQTVPSNLNQSGGFLQMEDRQRAVRAMGGSFDDLRGNGQPDMLADLVDGMKRGLVKTLFLSGVNPVYDAPSDVGFVDGLAKVPVTIAHSLTDNETSARCAWVLPATHDLEAWGDATAVDGTTSIIQPLIAPLYDGRSLAELLALISTGLDASGYDLVRQTWRPSATPGSPALAASHLNVSQTATPADSDPAFEAQWHRCLRDGVMSTGSELAKAHVKMAEPEKEFRPNQISLTFRPSAALWDGRHANNGWLQELPEPMTKLTWDNVAMLSDATAKQLGVKDADVVAISANGATIEVPVLRVPGHADGCITLPLGYGRTVAGSVGSNVGFNAYALRSSHTPWHAVATKIERTGRTWALAQTQQHFRIEGRDLLHVADVDLATPTTAPSQPETPPASLFPDFKYDGHRWAMTMDLNACIGCNACITACQSENNIPVVGKAQVLFGREMQWIRVDRYYDGSAENPRMHFQPVACMQCEKAPCEVVCPVGATQHDDEGLNVMVYNRCVGTRYCSNNCPYKVRRFNFLHYNAEIAESSRLRLNPNVTVRSRGVMEKCTYCVQRIEEGRIAALREQRPLHGSDIVTSCQAACPAEAIVFGDLSDPESTVSKNRLKPGHYALLDELDTQPRTTYLEKRINPNPALAAAARQPGHQPT